MTEPEHATPIVESLRGRILRGIQVGTLRTGDRLPSARELVAEFHADHRIILTAYRQLAVEGLVQVRERGGIYVAAPNDAIGFPLGTGEVFVELLTKGFAHDIAGPELHDWLRRVTETLRLRALVVATTRDQMAGVSRELRDDFGLATDGVIGSELSAERSAHAIARRADLVIATRAQASLGEHLANELAKPLLVVDVRADLVAGEWALLLRREVWAVVASGEVGEMLRRFFSDVPGVENLRVLVHGHDDLDAIPDGAPIYATPAVREQLGEARLRGRLLPPARTIATESARMIFRFIVRANIEAMRAVAPTLKDFATKQALM